VILAALVIGYSPLARESLEDKALPDVIRHSDFAHGRIYSFGHPAAGFFF
jgi:hypothetical protein